jgi:hypothetical protein
MCVAKTEHAASEHWAPAAELQEHWALDSQLQEEEERPLA